MKVAIISGGSRGIGAALCESYRERGYEVVEFSRSAPNPFSVRADFAEPLAAAAAVSEKLASFQGQPLEEIVVVSNAGVVTPVGPVARKEFAEAVANVNVNVASGILFVSAAIRQFQEVPCRKTVVAVSSGAALREFAGWSLYCAGKAAMDHFMRCVAVEQGMERHPFQAIMIEPGIVDTEMQASIREVDENDFPLLRRFIDFHETGALRPPRQVAEAIVKIVNQNTRNGERYSVADFT